MNTSESLAASQPPPSRPRQRLGHRQRRAFSLVEVMVAATIFTMLSMSATALFIQNQRTAYSLRNRTQVTNTALNILEQMRLKNYGELETLWKDAVAAPGSPHKSVVIVSDPAYVPPTPDPFASLNLPQGLRPLELNLNVVDNSVIEPNKTYLELPMESGANTVKLETRYWFTLKFNQSHTSPIVEAMELALVYEWKGARQTGWQEGSIRLVVANPQAVKNPTTSTTP